jgi:XTP/dITP diphosphohydrolase
MTIKLLIATNNPGKLVELQALLGDQAFELFTPVQLDIDLDVREDGRSYSENALLKGRAYANASGLLTLADDSGLEVDALGGQPGLHSARFVTRPGATDSDRRGKLLEALLGKPRPWCARFCCWVALVEPDGRALIAEGICEGEILPIERGYNGFGYDPIFLLPELGKTMAELDMAEKNRLSHRAKALKALMQLLENSRPGLL